MNFRFDLNNRTDKNRFPAPPALGLFTGALFAAVLFTGQSMAAQKKADSLAPLNRFPRMVQEYFVQQVAQSSQISAERISQLKNKVEVLNYLEETRDRIQTCFGPWPDKTPLNPRTTGVIERDEYTIEKIVFESRPGFLVTGNLYLPRNRAFPLPGVLGTCGHMPEAKAAEPYQAFAQSLARLGYIVFIYDPIGQAERLQYPDEDLKSKLNNRGREHLYAGNQQFLVGESFASWMLWDGIRALDYLLTRKEVNPEHIGVTGNSGGGTLTTWLCSVEKRLTMAAPSCFVTTFLRNTENELPSDTEQCPPKAMALGLEQADFLAAMAPEPIRILAKEKDFLDIRGTIETYRKLHTIYSVLGAAEKIDLFIDPGFHGYSIENRQAMYQWFNTFSNPSSSGKEPPLTIEKEQTLWCAPRGQVCQLNSKPVYEFTREKSRLLAKQRVANPSENRLRQDIRNLLKLDEWDSYREKNPNPEYRILRNKRSRKYPKRYATTYVVDTEPGIQAVVFYLSDEKIYSRPPQTGSKATLYISHHSSDAELRNESLLAEMMQNEPNTPFFTCDVRGIGDSQPDTCDQNSFLHYYGSDYFYAIHSIMLDRPYPGQKTFDVIRVIDWLKSNGYDDIHLVAKGWGTIPATFAAVLCSEIKQITLINALTSYADIAESETYNWPLSCFVPSILEYFDLPDCYRVLEKKNLRQIDPWNQDAQVTQESVALSST